MPFSIIPFLLLIIPILEIAVFITVGGQIGILWTFGLILLTAVIGSILLRVQGFQIINNLRKETAQGRVPGRELGHGAMILVAGVLLLTPGFVTDSIGFLLFLPPIRTGLWALIASRVKFVTPTMGAPFERGSPFDHSQGSKKRSDDGVVDLDPEEFSDIDDDDRSVNTYSPWIEEKDNK